jgi:hypothetical protein
MRSIPVGGVTARNQRLGLWRAGETAREHSDEIGTDDSGDDSECDKACDQASQDFADSPDYPGEGAWVCDCTMTDAGPMTVIQGVPDKDVEQ